MLEDHSRGREWADEALSIYLWGNDERVAGASLNSNLSRQLLLKRSIEIFTSIRGHQLPSKCKSMNDSFHFWFVRLIFDGPPVIVFCGSDSIGVNLVLEGYSLFLAIKQNDFDKHALHTPHQFLYNNPGDGFMSYVIRKRGLFRW
jgi:hypothetical protein